MSRVYRQMQVGWAVIVPLLLVVLVSTPILLQSELLVTAVAVGGGFSFLLLLFGTLTVSVDADAIEARFGIGWIKKRVPLADIRAYEPTTTPWYYGWGIRLYPGGRLYNVSGRHSVELFLRDGTRLRFGTAEPEVVCGALRDRIGALPQLSSSERAAAAVQSRRWAVGIFVAAAVLVGGIGIGLFLQSRPPEVTVSSDRIAISSFVYGSDIALADVRSASLLPSLPAIQTRTNGFAAGGTLRGHFRFTDLGDGELYVECDVPPFILVEHSNGFVIFNAPDPAQTRAWFDRIQAVLPGA